MEHQSMFHRTIYILMSPLSNNQKERKNHHRMSCMAFWKYTTKENLYRKLKTAS